MVALFPITLYYSTGILTNLINASSPPFGYTRRENIAYGADTQNRLDVYTPKNAMNAPVVVFWHGGMWMYGDKEDVRFVGVTLARAGYVVVIPNYRHYPQVRYPEFVDDGAQTVVWVNNQISHYGGDRDLVFLMGHSAGAYIATMLAFDSRFLQARGASANCLRGVIGLAGPYTFERPVTYLDPIFEKAPNNEWRPVNVASPTVPPTLLVHGEDDEVVWISEAWSCPAFVDG